MANANLPTHKSFRNLLGRTFGRLTVVEFSAMKQVSNVVRPSRKNPVRQAEWMCSCECGNKKAILANNLLRGLTISCGCFGVESSKTRHLTHGQSCSLTYKSWEGMLHRCRNHNAPQWNDYGGRGIAVCERWNSFEMFLEDMGERPSMDHSIDRFPNNNGNYEPGNCRWATRKEQGRNKRNNILLTMNGETKCLSEWSESTGIGRKTLLRRLHSGWTHERILTQEVRSY